MIPYNLKCTIYLWTEDLPRTLMPSVYPDKLSIEILSKVNLFIRFTYCDIAMCYDIHFVAAVTEVVNKVVVSKTNQGQPNLSIIINIAFKVSILRVI